MFTRPNGLASTSAGDWVRAPLELYLNDSDINVFDKNTSEQELEDTFIHFIEHNRFTSDDLVYLLEKTGFTIDEKTEVQQGRKARILARKSA